jgi:hypothetical protein
MRKNFISHLKKLHFASIGIVVAFLSIASLILMSSTHVFASSNNDDPMNGTTQFNTQTQQNPLGNATLTLNNGTLEVNISLTGLNTNGSFPAHIYKGTCENPSQKIKYSLNNVQGNGNGNLTSVTDIQNVKSIPNSKWYITVHNDPNLAGNQNTIACGNILNTATTAATSTQINVPLLATVNTDSTTNTDGNTFTTTQNTNVTTMPVACPVTTNTLTQTLFPCYAVSGTTGTTFPTAQSNVPCFATGAMPQNGVNTAGTNPNQQPVTLRCYLSGINVQQVVTSYTCYNATFQQTQNVGANQVVLNCNNLSVQQSPNSVNGMNLTTCSMNAQQIDPSGQANSIPLTCSFSVQTSTTSPTTFTTGTNQPMVVCTTSNTAFQTAQNGGTGTITVSCPVGGSTTGQNGGTGMTLSCPVGSFQNDGTGTIKLSCSQIV